MIIILLRKKIIYTSELHSVTAIQSLTRVAAHGDDKVFNVLPVFHSFGLTAGLIMPLTGGVPIYLYPSPLHYRIVPELVYQTNATILFGTDTFLNGYARVAHPYDFHSVRLILAGAEAVNQGQATGFVIRVQRANEILDPFTRHALAHLHADTHPHPLSHDDPVAHP